VRGTVWLVEDDLDVLDYYRFLLTLEGYEVWAADTNGAAALERYRGSTHLPDAVILDHRMPGCTGLELAVQLRELDPDVAIIFLTADDAAIDAARRLGFKRLKCKPCDSLRLLRNLEEAIAERKARLKTASR
jgi:CheY-like chemotaxis protein